MRQARLAIAGVFAIHGAVAGTFATRIPWIKDHLHLSAGQLGLALVMPGLGALLTLPFGGRIDHHLGSRRATSVLLPLWCAWLILPTLAPNLALLCAACFGLGATSVLCDVPMNAQGVAVEARLGHSIMSGLHGLWSCGGLVASAVGALAAHAAIDGRVHFAVASVVLLVAGLVVCHWLLDSPPDEEAEPPPAWALPERAVLVIGLAAFCAIFVEAASSDWAAVYLRDVTGAAAGTAIIGYTGYALAMTVGRLAGDSRGGRDRRRCARCGRAASWPSPGACCWSPEARWSPGSSASPCSGWASPWPCRWRSPPPATAAPSRAGRSPAWPRSPTARDWSRRA